MPESRYLEKKGVLPRPTAGRETEAGAAGAPAGEAAGPRRMQQEIQKLIPFLTRRCGLEFRGRILEIGAGAAWFSGELSKLPRVVEVIATDASPKLLKEQAPRVFKRLKAHEAKITRMPGDFRKLDFSNNHFDFVVCSAVLHRSANMLLVLREARRILKPGGQVVAIREPVWPLFKMRSRSQTQAKAAPAGKRRSRHTLEEYRESFTQAGFQLEAKRVNLSSGLKYFFDEVVNGLTHARYAFIGTKRGKT